MVWFIISCIIYFASILAMLFVYHKHREAQIKNTTPFPIEELEKKRFKQLSLARTGVPAQASQPQQRNGCLFMLLYFVYFGVSIGLPVLAVIISRAITLPSGFTRIATDTSVFSYVAAGAFGMFFVMFFPLSIHKLERAITKLDPNNSLGLSNRMANKIVVLFTFIVTFPFFALGLNYGTCYNNDEIRHTGFFAISPTTTSFSEITEVNRYFLRNKSNIIYSMHYEITLSDGEVLEILFAGENVGYIEQAYQIHLLIEAQGKATFNEVTDSYTDVSQFIADFSAEEKHKILTLFGM